MQSMEVNFRNAIKGSSNTDFSVMIKYQNNDVTKLENYFIWDTEMFLGAIGAGMAAVLVMGLICFLCCYGAEKCCCKDDRVEDED